MVYNVSVYQPGPLFVILLLLTVRYLDGGFSPCALVLLLCASCWWFLTKKGTAQTAVQLHLRLDSGYEWQKCVPHRWINKQLIVPNFIVFVYPVIHHQILEFASLRHSPVFFCNKMHANQASLFADTSSRMKALSSTIGTLISVSK